MTQKIRSFKAFSISITIVVLYFVLNSCDKNSAENYDSKNRAERIKNYKKEADRYNKSLDWKKTSFDLWRSKNGDLAVKTQEGTDVGISIDRYISKMADSGKPIKSVIDTATFKYVGNFFYKDKNHVYTHFLMAHGGNFWIVKGADPQTFQALGNCYAKDKNNIYGERAMKMDSVDYKTFKTSKECACFAKDKNGFYFWDDKINLKEADPETLSMVDKLKKL